MAEGDFTPRSYRPKPLSKAQLREMKKKFEDVDERIEKVRKLEEKEFKDDIDAPSWL